MPTASVTVGQLVRAVYSSLSSGNGPRLNVRLPAHVASLTLSNGTGNAQINQVAYRVLSFSGTTGQTIDLTAVADDVRGTVGFSRVKVLVLYPRSTTYTDNIVVGNAGSNIWTPGFSSSTNTITAYGSSPLVFTYAGAGWTVSGSAKNLLLTPSATQTADLFVAGLS